MMDGIDVVFKLAVSAALLTQVAHNIGTRRWAKAIQERIDALDNRLQAVQQLQMRQGRTPRLPGFEEREPDAGCSG